MKTSRQAIDAVAKRIRTSSQKKISHEQAKKIVIKHLERYDNRG